jgi:NTE family protein
MVNATAVFEGGGVKGIALAGAAAAAMSTGYRFTSTIGTSAGALVAALVSVGYTGDELESIVQVMPWLSLADRRTLARIPAIGPHLAMMRAGGVVSGRALESEVTRLLAKKGVRHFGDLDPGALRVVATDLSHGRGLVLPDDLHELGIDQGRFPVARAIRASSAVPFIFEPVRLRNQRTGESVVLADGALAARYPVQLADPAEVVIGFRLASSPDSHAHHVIAGPFSLAASVIAAGMTARESLPNLCQGIGLTVEVIVDRPPLDFRLTGEQALAMFWQAHETTLAQLPSVDA